MQPKNIVQGTVHRQFRCTKKLKSFDNLLKTNPDIWLRSQYPESWTAKLKPETHETFVVGKHKASNSKKKDLLSSKNLKEEIPIFYSITEAIQACD